MFKKRISIILVILLTFSLLPYRITMAEESNKKEVLLLYDRESIFSLHLNILNSLSELMGAYNRNVNTEKISDYKSGDIKGYEEVIILSIEGKSKNKFLVDDLKNYKDKIYYIGSGIDKLLDLKSYGLNNEVSPVNVESVTYNRDDFKKENETKKFYLIKNIDCLIVNKNNLDKVYSYINDGRRDYANIWKKGNLYHMALLPDEQVTLFMLADSLNDFFGITRKGKPKIFVRIEDVHLFRDPKELKAMADYLYGEGIPFIVALIPTYRNLKTGHVTKLSDMPKFVEAIKYMQDKGGSIILHGYDHGGFKGVNDNEDFEFWDGKNDSPVSWNLANYIHDNMGDAIQECVKNGIYPLGFEAPHYGMDSTGYKEIKKYFSTYVGQFQSSDESFTTTTYPYWIKDTEDFNKLLPENLGYVNPNNETWFDDFERNYDILTLVREPVGGFFYHPFIGLKDLKKIIGYLESKDVEFLDLKDYNNWVKWDGINIESENGYVTTNYKGYNKENSNEGDGGTQIDNGKKKTIVYKINNILIYVVGGFIIVFIIIFINFKRKGKRKFYR